MDTGQYSEDEFIAMGLVNMLSALRMTVEKSYEKPITGGVVQHAIFTKGRFRVHISVRYPDEK